MTNSLARVLALGSSLVSALGRHFRVIGIAVLFSAIAYGLAHLLFWATRSFWA